MTLNPSLFISPLESRGGWAEQESLELAVGARLARLSGDASPLVRREVVIALGHLCFHHRKRFVSIATASLGSITKSMSFRRERCVWGG